MPALNGDLSVRAVVDTARMEWTPSPSRTVWRKRVHLVGPPEAGQVTSVVRYEPQSTFHTHAHPDGEEILVLDGVFSDEHGDWPRGTYLLNPEGFRHAPFSRAGCVLFVKLRQFPGRTRDHVVVPTADLAWSPGPAPGIDVKALYAQAGFSDTVRLERWAAGTLSVTRRYPGGAEIFVLAGELVDTPAGGGSAARTVADLPESAAHGPGTWLRFPVGAVHVAASPRGCELYVKEGGLAYLRDERDERAELDERDARDERDERDERDGRAEQQSS